MMVDDLRECYKAAGVRGVFIDFGNLTIDEQLSLERCLWRFASQELPDNKDLILAFPKNKESDIKK